MRTGGARGGGGFVRSLRPTAHRNLPRSEIDDGGRNKEGRNLAGAALHQGGVFSFDDVEPSDPRADVHAHAFVILRRDLQFRHFQRFIRGGDAQMNEAPHLLNFFLFDEIQGVEVLNLGGNLAGKGGGVEPGNACDTTLAGKQSLPHHVGGIAHATDQAETRDYDPASQLFRLPVLGDIVDRVLHGPDLLSILVGNLDVKGLFEGHN